MLTRNVWASSIQISAVLISRSHIYNSTVTFFKCPSAFNLFKHTTPPPDHCPASLSLAHQCLDFKEELSRSCSGPINHKILPKSQSSKDFWFELHVSAGINIISNNKLQYDWCISLVYFCIEQNTNVTSKPPCGRRHLFPSVNFWHHLSRNTVIFFTSNTGCLPLDNLFFLDAPGESHRHQLMYVK